MATHRFAMLRVPLLVGMAAAAGVALVIAALSGPATTTFDDDNDRQLAAGEDIRALATLNRASYLPGERLIYTLQVAWRPGRVIPDFDALERNISFHPFDAISRRTGTRRDAGGSSSYLADFTLQAVDVEAGASYELGTVTVFYTRRDDETGEVQAIRTNPPRIHIGEYFPDNVTAIELLPVKPRIDIALTLRRAALIGGGVLLLAMCVAAIWWYGRRRPYTTLSPAEQSWRDFATLKSRSADNRWLLVAYEKFAARAFELRADIAPVDFWTSNDLGEWQAAVDEVRELVSIAYRSESPDGEHVAALGEVIDELLRPVVAEERLQRELHDDPVERLRRQPRVLTAAAGLLLGGIVAFILAIAPSLWVPADINAYNEAVGLLEEGGDLQPVVDTFIALAEDASDNRIRSASLYNAGTLLADPSLSRLSRDRFRNFMAAIFLADITLDRLMHDMELDSELELVNLLTELTRRYVQAEQLLKAAIRAGPVDADMGRNLEILGKIRRAIAHSLARLARLGDDAPGAQQMLSQTVIDLRLLMEAELPDDYAKFDEGKDDRSYFIMEKF